MGIKTDIWRKEREKEMIYRREKEGQSRRIKDRKEGRETRIGKAGGRSEGGQEVEGGSQKKGRNGTE